MRIPTILLLAACHDGGLGADLTNLGDRERIDTTQVGLSTTKEGLQIEIGIGIDPICRAADEERYYQFRLLVPDLEAVPLNTDIDLADPAGPVQPHFDIVCFCPTRDDDPDAVYAGTVHFRSLSEAAASFDVDFLYEGDTTLATDQEVSLEGSYDAPVQTRSRCR
jgi:hypothetical protein